MSTAEYRKALEQCGFDYVLFAEVIGVNERTVRRWADGSRKIPTIVSGVLRLLLVKLITNHQLWQAVSDQKIDAPKR